MCWDIRRQETVDHHDFGPVTSQLTTEERSPDSSRPKWRNIKNSLKSYRSRYPPRIWIYKPKKISYLSLSAQSTSGGRGINKESNLVLAPCGDAAVLNTCAGRTWRAGAGGRPESFTTKHGTKGQLGIKPPGSPRVRREPQNWSTDPGAFAVMTADNGELRKHLNLTDGCIIQERRRSPLHAVYFLIYVHNLQEVALKARCST